MIEIAREHRERFDASLARIGDAYRQKENGELPLVFSDVNYWLSGEAPGVMPEDYFTDPKSMFDYQVGRIRKHLDSYEDDYIPLLFPWYGTGVLPSALGCRIAFQAGLDPAVEGAVLREAKDIGKLSLPDPYRDGLMPRVLETIDYMAANSDLPVSFTDPQGPLNIALSICGVENLFLWMYDEPGHVREIMEFCTQAFIDWVKVQKEHAGQALDSGAFPHGIALPPGFGGVWLSDDDCTVLSPELYRRFVVPCNGRIFETFGGGTLHFCGTAVHQLENFLATPGLRGINNFCMGDFRQVARMQELFDGRLALMVCDFSPLDLEAYFGELLAILRPKGAILATFISPESALAEGKYLNLSRDRDELTAESYRIVKRLVGRRPA
jgi:hypothetical protein